MAEEKIIGVSKEIETSKNSDHLSVQEVSVSNRMENISVQKDNVSVQGKNSPKEKKIYPKIEKGKTRKDALSNIKICYETNNHLPQLQQEVIKRREKNRKTPVYPQQQEFNFVFSEKNSISHCTSSTMGFSFETNNQLLKHNEEHSQLKQKNNTSTDSGWSQLPDFDVLLPELGSSSQGVCSTVRFNSEINNQFLNFNPESYQLRDNNKIYPGFSQGQEYNFLIPEQGSSCQDSSSTTKFSYESNNQPLNINQGPSKFKDENRNNPVFSQQLDFNLQFPEQANSIQDTLTTMQFNFETNNQFSYFNPEPSQLGDNNEMYPGFSQGQESNFMIPEQGSSCQDSSSTTKFSCESNNNPLNINQEPSKFNEENRNNPGFSQQLKFNLQFSEQGNSTQDSLSTMQLNFETNNELLNVKPKPSQLEEERENDPGCSQQESKLPIPDQESSRQVNPSTLRISFETNNQLLKLKSEASDSKGENKNNPGCSQQHELRCPICHQIYTDKTYLTEHMNDHIRAKPYRCRRCIKTFAQRYQLKRHSQTHTAPKK